MDSGLPPLGQSSLQSNTSITPLQNSNQLIASPTQTTTAGRRSRKPKQSRMNQAHSLSQPLGGVYSSAPNPIAGPLVSQVQSNFIKSDAQIDDQQQKYCRCLLEVKAKGGRYNPYAICTHSVGAQVHSCSEYYDFPSMDLDALVAYADLHKITGYDNSNRQTVLNAIASWKAGRGESF